MLRNKFPMKIKKIAIGSLMLLASLSCYSAAEPLAGNDPNAATMATQRKPVTQDPFFRGIERSPQYNSLRNSGKEARQDDLRMLQDARYYRVVALYENEDKSKNGFLEVPLHGKATKRMQNGFYLLLGSYESQQKARQEGIDFVSNNASLINNQLTTRRVGGLKDKKGTYTLEYGPFNSPDLATATCFYIKRNSNQFANECGQPLKHLSASSGETKKTNSATIGLSQAGILQYGQNAMGFDPNAIADTYLLVREGELLGPQDSYVVRINHSGVHLANANGDVATIPAVTLPIHVDIKPSNGGATPSESPASPSNKSAEPSQKPSK